MRANERRAREEKERRMREESERTERKERESLRCEVLADPVTRDA
jgi:hypothetical protein